MLQNLLHGFLKECIQLSFYSYIINIVFWTRNIKSVWPKFHLGSDSYARSTSLRIRAVSAFFFFALKYIISLDLSRSNYYVRFVNILLILICYTCIQVKISLTRQMELNKLAIIFICCWAHPKLQIPEIRGIWELQYSPPLWFRSYWYNFF